MRSLVIIILLAVFLTGCPGKKQAVDIPPGRQSPFTVEKDIRQFRMLKPGTYTYRVILDADHRVTEVDESNNGFQGEFKVLSKQ